MTPPEPESTAVQLERLNGTMAAGFARVDGQLSLLVQRSDQTDRHLDDHEKRLDALERSRWPMASIGALTALAALAVTLWQAIGQ